MQTSLNGHVVAQAGPAQPVTDGPTQRAARFERDVLPHLDQVYGAARCLAVGQAAAEDLAGQTFARACAAFGQVEPGSNVTAWLYRILISIFTASLANQLREPPPATADAARNQPQAHTSSRMRSRLTPAQIQAVKRLPGSNVNKALQELPPDLRIVVYLADVEGLTCREIAGIVTAPAETVAARLHRGHRQLRELLGHYAVVRGPGTSKPARNDPPPAASPGRRRRSALQAHQAGQAKAAPASTRGHGQAQE